MRIKVCCIQSAEEARSAIRCGAHALGLVSKTLDGSGAISDEKIRNVADSIPPSYASVLLTSQTDPVAIANHQRATGTGMLQLVGPIEPESLRELRDLLPGIRLIKVVHVEGPEAIEIAARFMPAAHALLLDTKVKERGGEALGGTGISHDWSISRRIVEASSLPVFLAGGLSPDNVSEAVRTVRPFGVDACSHLRTRGTLDAERLRRFVARASELRV